MRVVIQSCKGKAVTAPAVNALIKNIKFIRYGSGMQREKVVDFILTSLVDLGLAENVMEEGGNSVSGPHARRCRWKQWSDIVQLPDFDALRIKLALSEADFP